MPKAELEDSRPWPALLGTYESLTRDSRDLGWAQAQFRQLFVCIVTQVDVFHYRSPRRRLSS
jgi:hypothetical protein